MRELGRGQSVVFLVSEEMREKITMFCRMKKADDIKVADVLSWSIGETWQELRKLMPLWATQGLRHQHQQLLWDSADTGREYVLSRDTATQFLESEAQTLRDRYHPNQDQGQLALAGEIKDTSSSSRRTKPTQIQERCKAFGVSSLNTSALEEEQERELSAEVEEERPPIPRVKPSIPSLHKDVKAFIVTGVIPPGSQAFIPAFRSLGNSSVRHLLDGLRLPHGLLATADFARTIDPPKYGYVSDAYQRPVQWIATAPTLPDKNGKNIDTAVMLSPWEANALLPIFHAGGAAATLHLFAPRTSLATRSVEDLALYTTPALPPGWVAPRMLVLVLLLFSGQLYLTSYADYVEMCKLLGVPHCHEEGEGEESREFGPAHISFFLGLVGRIRHHCTDISKTDIGRILEGDVLSPDTFSGPLRVK